jgi:hypothetical protein
MYIYLAVGASEMVFLFVVRQLSNETVQMDATKNYMVDYLDNVCAPRYKKAKEAELLQKSAMLMSAAKEAEEKEAQEKEASETVEKKNVEPMKRETVVAMVKEAMKMDTIEVSASKETENSSVKAEEIKVEVQEIKAEESLADIQDMVAIEIVEEPCFVQQDLENPDVMNAQEIKEETDADTPELSINIEGEPRAVHFDEQEQEEKRPHSKEAAIRLILEEFFA